jgi:hypothetical protein
MGVGASGGRHICCIYYQRHVYKKITYSEALYKANITEMSVWVRPEKRGPSYAVCSAMVQWIKIARVINGGRRIQARRCLRLVCVRSRKYLSVYLADIAGAGFASFRAPIKDAEKL